MRKTLWAAGLALALASSAIAAPARQGRYLFVFSGDQAAKGNDFLAVIDADPASPGYGKLLASVATDQVSVRPHHTEYDMPASGMLFANDHDANRSFVFDLTDPLHPNTDGDACPDGKEVASVNRSGTVEVVDVQQVASELGPYAFPGTPVEVDFDMTKNGTIDVLDLQQLAARLGSC